jgi:hypothetical protein
MSKGCDKADRQRKSRGNMKYIASKQDQVNAARKRKRIEREAAKRRPPKVERGTTRAERRWQLGITKVENKPALIKRATLRHGSIKPPLKVKPPKDNVVFLNGQQYTKEQALYMVRKMAEERKLQQQKLLAA